MAKRRKKKWRFILVFLVVALLFLNFGFGLGLGGFFNGLFPKTVPASRMVQRTSSTQIVIRENEIYLNDKVVALVKLKERLEDLQSNTDQVILKDEQAKRVTYNQVESLLRDLDFRIIKR